MAKLLLVDNDERIVELTAWFLEKRGHETRCALSYAEARGLIRESRPDLMLADLDLGHESGRVELPKLAEEGLLPPTLVVSGFLDAELERELTQVDGVLGALAKPFEMGQLEARVADCLGPQMGEEDVFPEPTPPPAAPEPDLVLELTPESATPAVSTAPELSEADEDGWVEIRPRGEGGAQ